MGEKFLDTIVVRCPPVLTAAIAQGSAQQRMSPSEYIRQAVMERLAADGIMTQRETNGIKPSPASHVKIREA